jgi:spoIIIJ-associated protein
MQWVETTGRTVEEAVGHALDELGVDQGDAEVEVLDEPRPGLFGKMRGQARVRARVRPTQPRPKQERRDRKRSTSASDRRPRPEESAQMNASEETSPEAGDPAEPDERPDRRRTETPAAEVDLEAASARVVAFLDGLLAAANASGSASATVVDGEVLVDVTGDDLGLFIGPKGQTLLAVQELARAVVSRRDVGFVRLRLDIAGYWIARREALGKFAHDVARSVIESGVTRVLEPMGAADRKIVHDAVAEIDGVVTRSQGEDPHRRVVISPA